MKYIAFNLILLGVFTLQVSAQSLLKKGKIPDDLLITLKRQEGWGGQYSEITITANGDLSYQTRGGLPVISLPRVLSINGKPVKSPRYLKPKLSNKKLKLLIAEFEKIQFFRFGKDFPQEDEKENLFLSDQASEAILMRVNGQTKEVFNNLGNNLKRTKLLRDLAERIRGAGVWNYENGEIPDNFQVSYRITDGVKIQRDFKIESNGKVTESLFSNKPFQLGAGGLPVFIKSKKVGKLSKPQIRQLINEFEKAVFSTFKYSTLSKYDGCSNEPDATTEKRAHINVQINHISQMYASLYENCNPNPETDAAKFEYMANEIEKLLKTIKTIKMN